MISTAGLKKDDIVYIYSVGCLTRSGNLSVILPSKVMYNGVYFELLEGKNKGTRLYVGEVSWARTINEAIEEFNKELSVRIEEENKRHEKLVEKMEKYRIL